MKNNRTTEEMQEETRRVLLSLRERLVGECKMYEGRMDKYKARGNSFTSTVDASYWNGITSGVSVAISHIDEEMRRLGDVRRQREGSASAAKGGMSYNVYDERMELLDLPTTFMTISLAYRLTPGTALCVTNGSTVQVYITVYAESEIEAKRKVLESIKEKWVLDASTGEELSESNMKLESVPDEDWVMLGGTQLSRISARSIVAMRESIKRCIGRKVYV